MCYDLRFPEVYQALTWAMGAKVLLVPSAFTKVTGRVLLHQVLPMSVTDTTPAAAGLLIGLVQG